MLHVKHWTKNPMFHIFKNGEKSMVEYEKIVGENHQNFMDYVLGPNGLVSLFIDNDWDVNEMPYGLIGDLDLMFLKNPYTTYNGVLLDNLTTNDKKSLTDGCLLVYEQLAKYFTKLHENGKTDGEIIDIVTNIDKSKFIIEIERGMKQITIHEKLEELKKDF